MVSLRAWIHRLPGRESRSSVEDEIQEEFRFHQEMRAAAFMAGGMSEEEARAAAARCFGDEESLRRSGAEALSVALRRERRARRTEQLGQDLRDGVRQFMRRPWFSILVAGTLALGLSTSTAVFTYVNAYHQPFPGADPRNLFQLYQSSETALYGAVSYPDYVDLQAAGEGLFSACGSAQTLFAASVRHETLTEVVFGQAVTGNFFPLVGVSMSLGRGLTVEDDHPGSPPAVVISHEYWTRRFARDPSVLGRTLLLNGQPYTIVGAAGPGFLGSSSAFRPRIWLPFEAFKRVYWARSDTEVNREVAAVSPYLRLHEGADPERVREALNALARGLDADAPLAGRIRRFRMEPATWIHPSVRQAEATTARVMMVAAACLLLLACANATNLILSAGARRHREMALRAAMGASRGRLVRQLLAENLLLSLMAGGMALVLAGPAGSRISSYFARPSVWGTNVAREISIDPRVLCFALAAATLAGVLTGLVPAVRAATTRDLAPALKTGGQWASGRRFPGRFRAPGVRDVLVSAQVALSVVLLVLAGLVLRTLDSAQKVDPGFDTRWTLASYVSTSSMNMPAAERARFFRDLVLRFEQLPWVRAATVAENAPLSGHPTAELGLEDSGEPVRTTVARVLPGYFEAMEMDILRGRSLLSTDTVDTHGVVVVNEALARRIAADGSAVGHRLSWPAGDDSPARSFEVVGVVRNARQTTLLDEPEPVAYFSLPQHYYAPGNAFLLKVNGDATRAVRRMEEELHAVDPRIAIVNVLPYTEVVEGFLYTQRMNAELFSVIALLGLILATAGIFGVVSLAVAQRRKEIGVRLAIGAGRGAITHLVVSGVSASLALGLLVGLGGALLATRLVESLLWGISASDPLALSSGVGVLLGAVVLAVGLPLRRAWRVDPVGSLQAD